MRNEKEIFHLCAFFFYFFFFFVGVGRAVFIQYE